MVSTGLTAQTLATFRERARPKAKNNISLILFKILWRNIYYVRYFAQAHLQSGENPHSPIAVSMRTKMAISRLSAAIVFVAVSAGTVLLMLVATLAAQRVESQVRQEAQQSAGLLAALLASEIEHYQALPIALATDGEVAAVLSGNDAAAAERLSRRFALISTRIGSAAIYVVAANGRTLAASNAGRQDSFVGNDYRFRQYFRDAMQSGRGTQFALGSTTRRPGLYLAQRVDQGGRGLGVIVVKVEFDTLEVDWQRSGTSAFVTDGRGDIIITTDPQRRFRRASAVLRGDDSERVKVVGGGNTPTFMRGQAQTIVPGWTVNAMLPVDTRINDAVTAAVAMTTLAILVGGGIVFMMWQYRRRSRAKQLADEQARQLLEERVEQRTTELSAANAQLLDEMSERRRAEEEARVLHEELEQANRLATLGQIAAGVTHEINQPVAAIRATADNAGAMIERGQIGAAKSALGKIGKLTERIGTITGELNAFSAKRSGRRRLVSVDSALDGALVLVGTGFRQAGVSLERSQRNSELKIWADKIRVEQILVNLLRNALEAIECQTDPRIVIDVRHSNAHVDIRIRDNGPGIAAAVASLLFTPFRTTKDQGLGLGLVISRDIAASLGGELNLLYDDDGTADQALRGATFQLLMPRAK